MGKNHASQYANFGSLRKISRIHCVLMHFNVQFNKQNILIKNTKELKNERNQIFKILLIDKTKPLVYLQYLA